MDKKEKIALGVIAILSLALSIVSFIKNFIS